MKIEDYPIGTKAYAVTGGYWEKTIKGWKWCTGATFPTPGGDVVRFEIPNKPVEPTADTEPVCQKCLLRHNLNEKCKSLG